MTLPGGTERARRAAPPPVQPAVARLALLDVVFAHWPVDVQAVARLLPPGIRPDTYQGTAYVGLVGVTMSRVSLPWLPALPYLGTFAQVNVRLYGVAPDGRTGAVFRSMDAARLLPGLVGGVVGLPYGWSRIRTRRGGVALGYEVERRTRGPRTGGELVVSAGGRIEAVSELEDFLTARWSLIGPGRPARRSGPARPTPWMMSMTHEPWPLHRARARRIDDDLVRAAGLPVDGPPVSLLWSPGVHARFGRPERLC